MKDVPSGTYNLEYYMEGFEEYRQFSVQHVGGTVPTVPYLGSLELVEMTTFEILKVEPTVNGSDWDFSITTTKPASGEGNGVVCFITNEGKASPTNYKRVEFGNWSQGTFPLNIGVGTLKNVYGFKSGQNISLAFTRNQFIVTTIMIRFWI
jgi:hypothetical protein